MTEKIIPLVLPSDYDEMEQFIMKNKLKLSEQVVTSVSHAVDNDLQSVPVFHFEDSDFIVLLDNSTFVDNLDNIFNYYIETEQYEYCDRVVKLKQLIQKNEQEKRYKSKGSSKRKN